MLLHVKRHENNDLSDLSFDHRQQQPHLQAKTTHLAAQPKQPKNVTTDTTYNTHMSERIIKDTEATYEGEIYKGLRHGRGKLTTKDGDIYKGEFDYGNFQGFGTLKTKEGGEVKGFWNGGVLDGHGNETWADGSKYNGHYKEGVKCGEGTYQWKDGTIYHGNWMDDKPNGKVGL